MFNTKKKKTEIQKRVKWEKTINTQIMLLNLYCKKIKWLFKPQFHNVDIYQRNITGRVYEFDKIKCLILRSCINIFCNYNLSILN